jgi:hypothetical protein
MDDGIRATRHGAHFALIEEVDIDWSGADTI